MARIEQVKMSESERRRRYFSLEFKKQKVKEIELGQSTVADISKAYQVSRSAVYKWLDKYSVMLGSKEKVVVEKKSDTKRINQLLKRIEELERLVGQKQILIEFHERKEQIARERYGIDFSKKNYGSPPSSGSGSTGTNTPTK